MRSAFYRSSHIWQDKSGAWHGLPVMRLYPEHSLTERETDILMKKGMYLMVIRIIQPYGGVMNYTDDLAFLLKQGWQTMDDPVNPGQKIDLL